MWAGAYVGSYTVVAIVRMLPSKQRRKHPPPIVAEETWEQMMRLALFCLAGFCHTHVCGRVLSQVLGFGYLLQTWVLLREQFEPDFPFLLPLVPAIYLVFLTVPVLFLVVIPVFVLIVPSATRTFTQEQINTVGYLLSKSTELAYVFLTSIPLSVVAYPLAKYVKLLHHTSQPNFITLLFEGLLLLMLYWPLFAVAETKYPVGFCSSEGASHT